MTPEAQRIAIAQACGWQCLLRQGREVYYDPEGGHVFFNELPDYLTDLNAMHEAEKVLTPGPWYTYEYKLGRITKRDNVSFVHATAAQRAEAFLRTLGLWRE